MRPEQSARLDILHNRCRQIDPEAYRLSRTHLKADMGNIPQTVVKHGTFLYSGTVECDVRILHSPVRFGSGDHSDTSDIRDDLAVDTFYVEYGSTTQRGVYTAGDGGHSSISEAIASAEAALGGPGAVKWSQ